MRKLLVASLLAGNLVTASCVFDTGSKPSAGVVQFEDCTLTQGYWKNHPESWLLAEVQLGATVYTQAEALAILNTPVGGNGLIALAHQLIAAKLNIALGADATDIADEIAAADALIDGLVVPPIGEGYLHPSVTSALNDAIDAFNRGENPCLPPPEPYCGDGELDSGEECDDGNNLDDDGCSADCTIEEDMGYCGDGELDAGEQCDDGNTEDGDGCSANCTIEEDGGECGDGHLDDGEQCDDGNNEDGDGCSSDCRIEAVTPLVPVCGDGLVHPYVEECDDGNTESGDGCSEICEVEAMTPVY